MLKKIVFRKLFARFDYDIEIQGGGITILTGPNGYGKSTILKSIEALSRKNLAFFMNLDYLYIHFIFDDEKANISFKKYEDGQFDVCDVTIPKLDKEVINSRDMLYYDGQAHFYDYRNEISYSPRNIRNYVMHSFSQNDELFENVSMSEWMDQLRSFPNSLLSTLDLADKKTIKIIKEVLDQLNVSSQALGQLHFVKEQRLIRQTVDRDKPQVINVIEKIPELMKKHIGKISNNYSSTANRLDSTYPERLFSTTSGTTSKEYNEKMREMAEKLEKLRKYDFLNLPSTKNMVFQESHSLALKVYFDDFNEKYKVYEDFIQKLDLFTDIINNRLSFKEMRISTEDGIKILDKEDSHVIRLNSLSSGEQQEIVMFYDLIFEAEQNSLLLIDEPEISLHIVWQKKFMDDLLRVVDYKKIHAIVATHSPQIINNHWDLQIDLGELYGG